MNRRVSAEFQVALGKRGLSTFKVDGISAFQTATSIDVDADAFSLDIVDDQMRFNALLARDNEIRAKLFINNDAGALVPIFTGIADNVQFDTDDKTLSIQGRDLSCLATDSDAPPGRWRGVRLRKFITKRARALGFHDIAIAKNITGIGQLFTDASETEWELWYRMARLKDRWIWTGPNGTLWVDNLAYHNKPAYRFGSPRNAGSWLCPEQVTIVSDKAQRKREVWVYAQDSKQGRSYVSLGRDTTIGAWTRKPLKIVTSSIAKTTAEAKKEADIEVFESIVGAYEITMTFHDTGKVIAQNTIALVQIPELGLNNTYYIVGVTRQGGPDGFRQVVRLREQGFALSKKKPAAPKLTEDNPPQDIVGKDPGSIGSSLSGVRWGDSFVRATQEHRGSWDFATFLGVLMAIADHESTFQNIRGIVDGYINRVEWLPYEEFAKKEAPHGTYALYRATFANDRKLSPGLNPRGSGSNTAVGPMQLVSDELVKKADEYGWNGKPKYDEFQGGRWNPDSNIRAGGYTLKGKLETAPAANPNHSDEIWIGVARYYGSNDAAANAAYANAVKKLFDSTYKALADAAVSNATNKPKDGDVTPNPQGSSAAIAKDILEYARAGKINRHPDIVATAGGNGISGPAGYVHIDNRVVSLILWLLQQGHTLYISAMCSDHGFKTTSGNISAHSAGRAIDIASIDGVSVVTNIAKAKSRTIAMDNLIRSAVAPLYPAQLISGGYGGHIDDDCLALCIPNSAFYNDGHTLQEHTNHIHVGYS